VPEGRRGLRPHKNLVEQEPVFLELGGDHGLLDFCAADDYVECFTSLTRAEKVWSGFAPHNLRGP
jgi:hypothetical protein